MATEAVFPERENHGVNFCQYRIFPDHIKLKKGTALRMKRNLKRIMRLYAEGKIDLDRAKRTLASYKGLLQHCDSYRLGRSIFGEYSDTEWAEGWFVLRRDSDKANTEKRDERYRRASLFIHRRRCLWRTLS